MMALQVFEKHPEADAYRVGGFYSPYAVLMGNDDKRLTDAELAAEWQQASGEASTAFFAGHEQEDPRLEEIAAIIERFATLPHYDEQ